MFARLLREIERYVPFCQARPQPLELNLDDLLQVLPREAVEDHDLVDPIEKLRPELPAQHVEHFAIKDLQQDIEDVRMRFLDLVEQNHGIGSPPHRFGELAACRMAR